MTPEPPRHLIKLCTVDWLHFPGARYWSATSGSTPNTIYDPVTKRRLTPQEQAAAGSFANAALVGVMSRSTSDLQTFTPKAITAMVPRQALDLVEARRRLTLMQDVFRK
ncbi:hypothetical protein OKW34_003496 [Paraburkholderia youngii]|uniref:hypothetical protein n=1 Tax=Paraburkholderia youngii TaxID=2782701 RepID=UPI003D1EDD39